MSIDETVSSVRDLCRFDVVLTTYGVVSSEMVKYETDIQARAITVSKGIKHVQYTYNNSNNHLYIVGRIDTNSSEEMDYVVVCYL